MDALCAAERFELRAGKLLIFSAGGDPPMMLRRQTAERGDRTDD